MPETNWTAGGQIQLSAPDALTAWYAHTLDESDTTPLSDFRFDASAARGMTVHEVLKRCGSIGAFMDIGLSGWFIIRWTGPSRGFDLDHLLAAVLASRRYRFKGWMHAVGDGDAPSVSIRVADGRCEIVPLVPDPGVTAESLQQLNILARPDKPTLIPHAQASIETRPAAPGTMAPDPEPSLLINDPSDPRLSDAPSRVRECISSGGSVVSLEGGHRYQWLLLERFFSFWKPTLLGDGEEHPVDIEPLGGEADVLQMGSHLILGGRFNVVRVHLDSGDLYTLIEARAPLNGMRLKITPAGLAVGTGEGVVFIDPATARPLFRFGPDDLDVHGLHAVDDGAIFFANHANGSEMFQCQPDGVTHKGSIFPKVENVWRDGEILVKTSGINVLGDPRPWSDRPAPAPAATGVTSMKFGTVRES